MYKILIVRLIAYRPRTATDRDATLPVTGEILKLGDFLVVVQLIRSPTTTDQKKQGPDLRDLRLKFREGDFLDPWLHWTHLVIHGCFGSLKLVVRRRLRTTRFFQANSLRLF